MAPSKRSRSVNKRYAVNEAATPPKATQGASQRTTPRKKKLTELLGPRWSEEELERFYKAYRKHGKDWDKVASAVRNRSVEMVEALFTMNRAYLSLPKSYASAAGLVAMMTDHYSNLEDTDSDQDMNEDIGTSRRPIKRARGSKEIDEPKPDLLRSQSAASDDGCLSLLKKRRSGSRPWTVGKRTPRVPVSFSYDKDNREKYISSVRRGVKIKPDELDDDVAHEIALALAEASQRGGSPQLSQTPNRKPDVPSPYRKGNKMHAEYEMTSGRHRGTEMDEGGLELSLGSTEADAGDYRRSKSLLKGRRYHKKKPEAEDSVDDHFDDTKEACSGTDEGRKLGGTTGEFEMEDASVTHSKSSNKGPRKKSKKVLFGEDEDAALDALQTLADLSLRLPETPLDTESSVHVEEEKLGTFGKSKLKGSLSIPGVKVTSSRTTKQVKGSLHEAGASPKAKEEEHQNKARVHKKKQKSTPSKVEIDLETVRDEQKTDSYGVELQKVEATDVCNTISKGRDSHDTRLPKRGKFIKPSELASSSTEIGRESNDSAASSARGLAVEQFNLPTKVRSRRKINTPKPLIEKDKVSFQNTLNGQGSNYVPSFNDRVLSVKEKLSNCLSWYQVRRWLVFEWFYSAIDYPWFAKREFEEYLDHVGLGHIPRLTRVEWGVIRSSLGKPRRFSSQFLHEEKVKLNLYRISVRRHYAELRAGIRDGLPTDLARPLSVGQRVIALHPRTREIHDGSVLTVDHSRCRIQFDQPELGVEFVMDIDCMPLDPLENIPASLAKKNVVTNKFMENLNELKVNGHLDEKRIEGHIKLAPTENLEISNGHPHTSLSTYLTNNLQQQVKCGSAVPDNAVLHETSNGKLAANVQNSALPHLQAKEADIRALSDLTRALDKKEKVLSVLKHMNDDMLESQKDGGKSLKDSEPFKKYYAAVVLKLNEVNQQVSSALTFLRQRNTYQGTTPTLWSKPVASVGEPIIRSNSFDPSTDETNDSGSHVMTIVEISRARAQTMVNAALQAMSSLRKEGSEIDNIEDAIDFVSNRLSGVDLSTTATRMSAPTTAFSHYQSISDMENALGMNHTSDSKLSSLSDQSEADIPSDLIAQCLATLLMIQKCTERQFPPSEVAQVLESAVTGLKPCCSQNQPIYAEIQKCMGMIRNQILALVPT